MTRALFVLCLLSLHCGDDDMPTPDAGVEVDSGMDATSDTGVDVGLEDTVDGGPDSAADAGLDASVEPPMDWDGTIPDEWVCTPHGFCFIWPRPSSLGLFDAWANTPDDVWAVGQHGGLIHWNGSAFHGIVGVGARMVRVHGCSSDDVWAIDSGESPRLLGIDGNSFELEGPRRLLHWDGTRWSVVETPRVPLDVHCRASDDVWIVGHLGAVYRYNGSEWNGTLETGGALGTLHHIESRDSDVLIAGDVDTVEWDGSTFRSLPNPVEIRDITVAIGRYLAATDDGEYVWNDGWELENRGGRGNDVTSIAGNATGAVALVADGPFIDGSDRLSSTGWTTTTEGRVSCAFDRGGRAYRHVAPVSDTGVWLLGGEASPWDGDSTCILTSLGAAFGDVSEQPGRYTGLLAAPDVFYNLHDDAIWRVGLDGIEAHVTDVPIRDATLVHASLNEVWVLNDLGTSARWFDGTWTEYRTGMRLTSFAYSDGVAWAASAEEAVGALYRWDNDTEWVRVRDGGVRSVVAGEGFVTIGLVDDTFEQTRDETVWEPIPAAAEPVRLRSVGTEGGLWAITETLRFYRWDGATWDHKTTADDYAAFAFNGDDAWLENRRWDGERFVPHLIGLSYNITHAVIGHGQVWLIDRQSAEVVRKNL